MPVDEGRSLCSFCGGPPVPSSVERGLQPLHRPGDVLDHRFTIQRHLGSGASGVVYGAFDALRQGRVALKILWESAALEADSFRRLRREIAASQKAPDERLVAIYDILILEGRPALVMEWVEGETVRDRIRREGALAPRDAERTAHDLLSALAHLHELSVVHRDVKSSNILLDGSGRAKLGDFGLAKGEPLGGTLTETGVGLGTPGYMAPEVIRGEPATPASDRYGAGVVLFEMLTGRLPYQGASALEVASRQLSEPPPLHLLRAGRIPRWLASLTGRLLQRDPADRFASTRSALEALERRRHPFAPTRRQRRWVAAAVVGACAALGGAVIMTRSSPGPLRVSFEGRVVEARTDGGRLLWRRTLPQPVQSVVEGTFGPGGSRAVACAVQWDPASHSPYDTNRILVLDVRGVPLQTLEASVHQQTFSHRYRVDLDVHRFRPDGPEQLVAHLRHITWYPSGVLVFNGRALDNRPLTASAEDLSFGNSGTIGSVDYGDADGDGTDEVLCAGINNRLYRMLFAAALRVGGRNGLADGRALSPDLEWQDRGSALFYRLVGASEVPGMALVACGRGLAPTLELPPDLKPWEFGAGGLGRRGETMAPPASEVERIDLLLPDLCALRDQRRWRDLEQAASRWPEVSVQPYAWLGVLFRAHALMGLGRYDACGNLLEGRLPGGGGAPAPLYAYQFWADSAFLAQRYAECSARVRGVPRSARLARPELGHTALWAAVYSGDQGLRSEIFRDEGLTFFRWYPRMFEGVGLLMSERASEAEAKLESLRRDLPEVGDVDLWLARSLLAQGKGKEALSLLAEARTAAPGEGVEESLTGLEARWLSGEDAPEGLVRQADGLLANARREAVTSVEARALLPLELAAGARLHRAAGDRAGARSLEMQAVALAPAAWRAALRTR